MIWEKDTFLISSQQTTADIDFIHDLLRQPLWTGDADNFYRQVGFEELSTLKFISRNWKM